ncbi:glycoside hydrolase family 20 zincin-like fold domain-containing protein [Fodinicola acaciae]|uniref:glycoside hydrolase family 20 zincin-like fold domain-containing protein n=1 Tax=Fodinicola acaciae TaxID=2681555 RepID=UPI0013D6C4C6|nr:glycoside hydrolase family 20 zincin-like fold domain-containing protein [Fodinicola acaciae]
MPRPGLPAVLPAIQRWTAGGAQGFGWTGNGRIVVNTADSAALAADARTFATDVGVVMHQPAPPVVTGVLGDARAGDVFVGLGSTDQLGSEGYALTVAPVLQLSARAAAGVFWGTRTVRQLLRQSRTLPAGAARDWPRYRIRAALVDGQPFPMGWWFNEVRELSYLKINEMRFPANAAGMTEAQERQLDAFARTYHVELTPLIDMPAYLNVDETPLPDAYALRGDNGEKFDGALDLTNPDAVAWARGLITGYIDGG